MKIKEITATAVFAALVFVVTRFIQIPIPLGYFNVGNAVILLSCVILRCPLGAVAGSLGSALADLTSYPEYTLPTLLIKAVFPLVYYALNRLPLKNGYVRAVLAAAISTLFPLFGYTLTGAVFEGSIVAGFAQFPGLALEYAANLVLFIPMLIAVKKAKLDEKMK